MKSPLPRPRIQRVFVRWFAEHRRQFLVPVRLGQCTRNGIEIEIPGFGGAIHGFLNAYAIDVVVSWQGEVIDLLQSFEAAPMRSGDGYLCGLCLPEHVRIYPDRDSLWREQLFEPFLEWVNVEFHKALRLNLYRTEGASWASLEQGDTMGGDHCIASLEPAMGR